MGAGPVKISTSATSEREQEQAHVTTPGAFAFKPHENRTFGRDFTWFFSLQFSLQFWYRWKEGNNSGITSKFDVDPSKRSRVRAERSRKVERKSGRTLEICSVAQSRFRPPPGARRVYMCAYVACKTTVPDRCASVFSFLFFSFFFLHPFLIAPSWNLYNH